MSCRIASSKTSEAAANFVQDDGFIAFRYVKNFLRGHGLVYNPGDRVEGIGEPGEALPLPLPAV